MRNLLFVLACAAAAFAQERALVHVTVDDYARLQAQRLIKAGAPVTQLRKCRILQPYTAVFSGVVISPDGEILTPALHPRASLRILVTMPNGKEHLAELQGTDWETNLALVKVPVKTRDYLKLNLKPHARMQDVRVFGHAAYEALPEVVKGEGRVARLRQQIQLQCFYTGRSRLACVATVVTFSAMMPRSGAICVDDRNALLGLRISGIPPGKQSDGKKGIEGHLVVPSARIARVVKDLRAHGRVRRVNFGIGVMPVPDSLRAHIELPASAASINRVSQPAAAAGLRPNDVILDLDGKTYRDPIELFDAMSHKPARTPVTFNVLRAGKKLSFQVIPIERK